MAINIVSGSSGGSVIGGINNQAGLDTVTGLEELATANGYKESKVLNALDKVGRVLNFGTANVAGAVRGAIQGEGMIAGAKKGREENLGFSEVYRDIYGKPETKLGKVAVGVGGFAADVLFDPLTYLTLGTSAGVKVGGQVLNKGGTRLLQSAKGNVLTSTRDTLLKEGMSMGKAKRISQTTTNRIVNDIFSKSLSKKGLTREGAEKIGRERIEEQIGRKMTTKEADNFLDQVIRTKDLDIIMQSGTKLLDEGGIKWFGKTLVKSETIKNTLIGRAARRLGQTEIAQAVQNSLGRLFVNAYKKNPRLQEIIGRSRVASMRAFKSINDSVDNLFKDFTEPEHTEFFNAVFDKRTEVLGKTREIQDETIKRLNEMFPDMKVKDKDSALRLYESLDEVHHTRIAQLHKKMEDISRKYFKKREAARKEGAELPKSTLGNTDELRRIDELNNELEILKVTLREEKGQLGSSAKKVKSLDDLNIDMSDANSIAVANKLVRYEEERLAEQVDKMIAKIRVLRENGIKQTGGPAKNKGRGKIRSLEGLDALIKELERDYATKAKGLVKIIDSKRIAKASQIEDKLRFFKEDGTPNKKLNDVADKLFEGNGAVVRKLAKEAGISEEDAFKFYLPSKFRDQVKVKEFAMGRYLSTPSMSFKKDFNGVVNDQLIRHAGEALKRGKLEVRTAKIKSKAITTAIGEMGIKQNGKLVTDLTTEEAKRMGVVKFSRKTIDGEVSGYVPKEVAEELNEFVNPGKSAIDDAAKALGFDWVTSLFKGYVTSLFPAFHARNMIGNEFLNFTKFGVNAFDPRVQKRAVDIVMGRNLDATMIAKDGTEWTNAKIIKAINNETDFLKEGAFGDSEQLLRGLKQGKDFNPLSPNNIALRTGRNVGSKLESQSKLVGVITSLMEGKTIKEGVKEAEEALFNYSKITPFERSVMRRLIPFYTFARKNFELQLKALATTPGRTASQIKFIRGVGETVGEPLTDEDKEGLPSWVVDSLGIKAGANEYGQSTYLTGFGLPVEEFLQRFSGEKGIVWNAISSEMAKMNPAVKYPLERATGLDFFRGRPIMEISNGGDLKPILDSMPDAVSNELKAFLNYQEREVNLYVDGKVVGKKNKVTADPIALHLFRNLPTARMQATGGSLFKDEEPNWMTAMRLLSGVRGETIDTSEQKYFNELKKKQELTNYLTRMGIIGVKEIPFEKKGQTPTSVVP